MACNCPVPPAQTESCSNPKGDVTAGRGGWKGHERLESGSRAPSVVLLLQKKTGLNRRKASVSHATNAALQDGGAWHKIRVRIQALDAISVSPRQGQY